MPINFESENHVFMSYSLPNFTHIRNELCKIFSEEHSDIVSRCQNNNEVARLEAVSLVQKYLSRFIGASDSKYSDEQIRQMAQEFYFDIIGYGPIHELYYMPGKTDLYIDGPYHVYWEDARNNIHETDIRFRDHDHLEAVINKMLAPVNESIDKTRLNTHCALRDGTRFAGTSDLVVTGGIHVSLRFQRDRIFTPQELIDLGTWTPEIAWFLKKCVEAGANIIFFGDVGSGKTSNIATLCTMVPDDRRFAIISDTLEIFLKDKFPLAKCIEYFERTKGKSIFTVYDALKDCLRQKIKHIFFNEVRSEILLELFEAWQTGRPGASGLHAEDQERCWDRMITLLKRANSSYSDETCARIIAGVVDVMVECRCYGDKKIVFNVFELTGIDGINPIYSPLFRFVPHSDGTYEHECLLQNATSKIRDKFIRSKMDLDAEHILFQQEGVNVG